MSCSSAEFLSTAENVSRTQELLGHLPSTTKEEQQLVKKYDLAAIQWNLHNPRFFSTLNRIGDFDCMYGDSLEQTLFLVYDIARFFSVKTEEEKLIAVRKLSLLLGMWDVDYYIFSSPIFAPVINVLRFYLRKHADCEGEDLVRNLLLQQLATINSIENRDENSLTLEELVMEYESEITEVTKFMLFVIDRIGKNTVVAPKM